MPRQLEIPADIVADAIDVLQRHPFQYGFFGNIEVWHTEDMLDPRVGERFNRCPVCEQWSPCAVRKIAQWVLEHAEI